MICPICKQQLYVLPEVIGKNLMIRISCDFCEYEGFEIEIDLKEIDPKKFKYKARKFKAILQL
ncbi:MAG: hypothetical protein QXQ94_09320 [Candidatus Bathyarchaeia archaeon]